jgi:hypothetical protein
MVHHPGTRTPNRLILDHCLGWLPIGVMTSLFPNPERWTFAVVWRCTCVIKALRLQAGALLSRRERSPTAPCHGSACGLSSVTT